MIGKLLCKLGFHKPGFYISSDYGAGIAGVHVEYRQVCERKHCILRSMLYVEEVVWNNDALR